MSEKVKVDHSAAEMASNQTYILTLKDASVLDEDADDAVLENIELQSSFRQRMNQKRKQQQIDYKSSRRIDQTEEGLQKNILGQYDDVEEVEDQKRNKIYINQQSSMFESNDQPIAIDRDNALLTSLAYSKNILSDFDTAKPVKSFNKKK